MKLLEPLRDLIKQSEDRELLTYLGLFGGTLTVIMLLLGYYHYSNVSWYTTQFRKLETLRNQTKTVVKDAQLLKAQQKEVDEILAKDRDFRIVQAFQTIIRTGGFASKLVGEPSTPTTGETTRGKTEVQINANLRNLSMKEVSDLLVAIGEVPQLYTKEVTVKKSPGRSAVDVDIVVATLEPTET